MAISETDVKWRKSPSQSARRLCIVNKEMTVRFVDESTYKSHTCGCSGSNPEET